LRVALATHLLLSDLLIKQWHYLYTSPQYIFTFEAQLSLTSDTNNRPSLSAILRAFTSFELIDCFFLLIEFLPLDPSMTRGILSH
jgi:hypothetical protein